MWTSLLKSLAYEVRIPYKVLTTSMYRRVDYPRHISHSNMLLSELSINHMFLNNSSLVRRERSFMSVPQHSRLVACVT
jgi:hypothetical protein